MRKTLKRTARRLLGDRFSDYLLYSRYCRRTLKHLGLPNGQAEGEGIYRRRWRQFSPWVDPYIYRLASHFCGPTPDIIPEDILHRDIELTLNPRSFWNVYEDKNMFPLFVGAEHVPATVAARVRGGSLLGPNLLPLHDLQGALVSCPYDALILKPSMGTCSGMRVTKFRREGAGYVGADGKPLTLEYLMAFGPDWVLQQCVRQHPFTARNCPSATNTMRIVVYRSVVDDEPHVTSAYFRYGGPGAVVDNAHAGGRYVGMDLDSGRLHATMHDDQAHSYPFPDAGCVMPSWHAAVQLAHHVARCIPHHHLFALDMAIDENGKPMLLEYNIGGFSAHAGYHCGQTVFGPYLDEVIEYCLANR